MFIPPKGLICMKLLWSYLLIVNAAGFLLMHLDKKKAKAHAWRIPEATLMTVAAVGGSLGAILGMYTAHHKTKHPKFSIGLPCILAVHIGVAVLLLLYF